MSALGSHPFNYDGAEQILYRRPDSTGGRRAAFDGDALECLRVEVIVLMAQVEDRVGKVDRWHNSQQKQRWLATALVDIEPRLRRLRGYRALPKLRLALQRTMRKEVTAA